jgi:hypothetical protein
MKTETKLIAVLNELVLHASQTGRYNNDDANFPERIASIIQLPTENLQWISCRAPDRGCFVPLPNYYAAAKLPRRRWCALSKALAVALSPETARAYGRAVRDRQIKERPAEAVTPFFLRLRRLDLVPESYRYRRAVGVEIEGYSMTATRADIGGMLPYFARTASDASIHSNGHPCEVRMLLNRAAIEPRLKHVLDILHNVEFRGNRTCGLHVHLHGAHLSQDEKHALQARALKWLKLLAEFVPPSRRENQFCRLDMTPAAARRSRYAACNICTGHKQTIEFRLHSATTDLTKITMWVRLCELLMVMPAPKRGTRPGLAALDALPLCEWDRAYWVKRHADLNPRADLHGSTNEEGE